MGSKKIKHRNERVPAVQLPFMPTNSPGHEHVLSAAQMILVTVQNLFMGNPEAIITAIKACEHAYTKSILEEKVMTQDKIDENLVLGMKLGEVVIEASKREKLKAETNIVTPEPSAILDARGNPVVSGK